MAIHNKSHCNHALMTLNRMRKESAAGQKGLFDLAKIAEPKVLLNVMDCCDFLSLLPDESADLICIDPPYNLELTGWDVYENYIDWASIWINDAYRVLSKDGSMAIFGGIQFMEAKSGDLIDIIQYIRQKTRFKLINIIVWH